MRPTGCYPACRHASATVVFACASVAAFGAELQLTAVADDDSRWYEHFSDAFVELGRDPEGFYLISQLPAYASVGQPGGVDAFPNDNSFDLGTLTYDDAELSGTGVEIAPVTAYEVEFDISIADDESVSNTVENQGYETTVSDLTGTVEFTAGTLTSIDLQATITFTYDFSGFSLGMLDYVGTIALDGDRFELLVDDTNLVGGGTTEFRYEWDAGGVIDQVQDAPPLPGDYDGSGVVDEIDYQLWVSQFGSVGPYSDGNDDGIVDAADYTVWRDNVTATAIAVPEPRTLTLILTFAALRKLHRRRSQTLIRLTSY